MEVEILDINRPLGRPYCPLQLRGDSPLSCFGEGESYISEVTGGT